MDMPTANMEMCSSSEDDQHLYLNVWQQLMLCSKTLEQEISNRFRKHFKQSLVRYELLSQLTDGKWLPIGKAAEKLVSSNGNITKLVERMIAEDLLHRRRNQYDRRVIEIGLSTKGELLLADMANAHATWIKSLMNSADAQTRAADLQEIWQRTNNAA